MGARNFRVVARLALLCYGHDFTPGLAVHASGPSRFEDVLSASSVLLPLGKVSGLHGLVPTLPSRMGPRNWICRIKVACIERWDSGHGHEVFSNAVVGGSKVVSIDSSVLVYFLDAGPEHGASYGQAGGGLQPDASACSTQGSQREFVASPVAESR